MIQYPCKPCSDRARGLATDTWSRLGSVEMAFLQGLVDGEQPGAEGVRDAHIPTLPDARTGASKGDYMLA